MAFLGQEEQIREFQDRFRYLYAAVFIALGILLSRLVFLQILNGEKFRQSSEENRIKRVKVAAPRGMIFDRNKTLLIDNRPAFDLEIIPQYLREYNHKQPGKTQEVLGLVSKIVKIPVPEIEAMLKRAKIRGQPSFMPVKIKTDLTRDEVAIAESWKISMPGVQIQQEIKRTNIYGDIASHLLGYIGEVNPADMKKLNKDGKNYNLGDDVGKFGLEMKMEETLRGQDGEKLVEVDALGRIKLTGNKGKLLSGIAEKEAHPGKNLILTIDQDLQLAATKAFGDKIGSVVAIDPRNGEILAMLSRPSFDPTEFARGIPTELWRKLLTNENRPLRDKTIQDHYPPGSVFKVVTAIAGLESGVVDEHTRIPCSGSIRVGSHVFHCWKKQGHGSVNVAQAITESCDVYFYRVAQKLKSVDDIARWAFHLGLGKKTDINLAHEIPGLIPTEAWKMKRFNQPWSGGETLSVAIGQSYVLTTAIQLANLYASIANGGTLYKPYFTKKIETYEGDVEREFQPAVLDQTRLSPKTYQLVTQGLWDVVNSPRGTAHSQRLQGMDFVGKTGTAQVARLSADKIYSKCENMPMRFRHHGLFAGYAPAKDPKIAVAVVAEHACHGNSGAAPIARAVIKTYLQKYHPELYSEKALAARIPGYKPEIVIREITQADGEDQVANDVDADRRGLPEPGEIVAPPPPLLGPGGDRPEPGPQPRELEKPKPKKKESQTSASAAESGKKTSRKKQEG